MSDKFAYRSPQNNLFLRFAYPQVKNGIRIARSKYHVTLSVSSRWCHKHSMQFEHSILLLLLSFLRDRNRLIPRYSCPLSRSTSLFSSEAPQCRQKLSRVWHQRDVTFVINLDQSPDHLKHQNGPTSSTHKIFRFNPRHLKLRNRVFQTTYFLTVPKKIRVICTLSQAGEPSGRRARAWGEKEQKKITLPTARKLLFLLFCASCPPASPAWLTLLLLCLKQRGATAEYPATSFTCIGTL